MRPLILLACLAALSGCAPIYAPVSVPVADPEVSVQSWTRWSGFLDGDVQAAARVAPRVHVVGGASGSARGERGGRGSAYVGAQYALEWGGTVGAGVGGGGGAEQEPASPFGGPVDKPAGTYVQTYAQMSVPLSRPGRLFVVRGSVVHHTSIRDENSAFETRLEPGRGTTLYVQPALIFRGRGDRVRPEFQIGASLPVAGLLAGEEWFAGRVCRPYEYEGRQRTWCDSFSSGGIYASLGFHLGGRD